ncbi:MAG: malonate decarboxylase subunit delta [Burkholderiales bacterium]|nr:malonate decarboxylase subunit delta [Burkholderiales bacterium]MDE1929426.1 malonate decarboxylase subunit delta [Burkholderiales bacterium]MDE2159571.1 malonate decarboxylase subunit delta [Burkholderiales bacterium]
MQTLEFQYPAGTPASARTRVGVVGSGDLEVLLEPGAPGRTTVRVTTSVDGFGTIWQAQLDRVFGGGVVGPAGPAAQIEINDFGATPGVVGLRIAQAFAALGGARGAPA